MVAEWESDHHCLLGGACLYVSKFEAKTNPLSKFRQLHFKNLFQWNTWKMYAGLFAPSQLHADAEADTTDSDADTTTYM